MRNRSVFHAVLPFLVLLPALATAGMVALEDEALSEFTGEGIAIVLEDFRFQMKNTGYIEQIGTVPATGAGFQRGDMRWYGLTLSGGLAADGLGWTAEACGHLLCPIANKGALIAPFDNPYLLRVFDKTGWDFQNASVTKTVLELIGPTNSDAYRWAFWGEIEVGKTTTGNAGLLQSQTMIVGKPVSPHTTTTSATTTSTATGVSGSNGTTYTYTATSSQKVVRSSCGLFGGNCNATTTTDTYTFTTASAGQVLRLARNQNTSDGTLALNWHSRLSGDFRLSFSQTSASPDAMGSVPLFANGTTAENAPGLKFRNVNAYFPLGQLFYQSIIFDDNGVDATTAGNGNFVIELTRLPNQTNAYNDFYSFATGIGCEDPRFSGVNCGYQRNGRPNRYYETHGYSRWGDWYPGNGANCGVAGTVCNTFDSAADGIIFSKATAAGTFTATATRPQTDTTKLADGLDTPPPVPILTGDPPRTGLSSVNLGDSRIEGILIQHLKITSLGAGP